jgi:hypothetical protein
MRARDLESPLDHESRLLRRPCSCHRQSRALRCTPSMRSIRAFLTLPRRRAMCRHPNQASASTAGPGGDGLCERGRTNSTERISCSGFSSYWVVENLIDSRQIGAQSLRRAEGIMYSIVCGLSQGTTEATAKSKTSRNRQAPSPRTILRAEVPNVGKWQKGGTMARGAIVGVCEGDWTMG